MERGPGSRRGAAQVRQSIPRLVRGSEEELAVAKMDRTWVRHSTISIVIILTAGLILFGKPLQARFTNASSPTPKAISTVLLSDDSGHGSGVHLGHGFILTAAHVVEDHSEMEVTDSDGHKQTGKVLWANKTYDVALIQVPDANLAASPLNCSAAPPRVGDEVVAIGNPLCHKRP